MKKHKFLAVTSLLLFLSAIGGNEARADNVWKEAGLGVVSVVSSAIYSPIKINYAALGALTGGVAWVVTGGNTKIADGIWRPAVSGDYVITPQILRGGKTPGLKTQQEGK